MTDDTAAVRVHADAFGALERLAPRRGAEVLLEILESEGVRYIFGNPGTTELPLIDALVTKPDIAYVWALQEASVVAMADGYAQAARRPGFVNLHTAGGLGHGMGGLINASVSNTPLVVTAGQQDSRHTVTDPLLFGDLVGLARPTVKWAQEVTTAAQLPVLVRRAFHDCNAAPAGAVFLSLPMDVMEEMTAVGLTPPSTIDRRAVGGSLGLLAEKLAAVKPGRLVIVAGDEIDTSDAAGAVVRLAESLGAPVFGSSWPARIPFPTSHPLWSGNLPTKATEIHALFKNYDVIFGLGGKSVITILYTEGPVVPTECTVYQLSMDVRDLGRTYASPLSVFGDIRASLDEMQPMLDRLLAPERAARGERVEAFRARRRAERASLEARVAKERSAPVTTPIVAAHEIVRAIGPRTHIVDEAIATSNHMRAFLDSDHARQYSFLRGGGLGWGMPAACGFSLGFDREPVVSLVGDGAAMYSPQALWTAAHEKLPVTFVVINNREYNILKNFMKGQAGYLSATSNRFIAMDLVDPEIDFLALARSMGVPARRAERAGDIAGMVEEGIRSGVANLIEVPVAPEWVPR